MKLVIWQFTLRKGHSTGLQCPGHKKKKKKKCHRIIINKVNIWYCTTKDE